MNTLPAFPARDPSPTGPVTVHSFAIPGPAGIIPMRLYRPAGVELLPTVLYFHGGGFVGGGLDDADVPARFIAQTCPAAVLTVGYALAPKRPFPAAPEDAYAAALWTVAHAPDFGADPLRLAVAGDDAGGNIAACLALIARDRGVVAVSAQALIGPMLDPSMTRLGDATRLRSDLTAADCADCYRQYLPQLMQRIHPYAAPLESRRLRGLPPACIATAECDVLHVEAELYAAELIAVGVRTQVARFADVTHAALRSHLPALEDIVHFLRRQLALSLPMPAPLPVA